MLEPGKTTTFYMLYLSIKYYLFKEQIKVIKSFYKDLSYALLDFVFILSYLFTNPYRVCRKFYQKLRGKTLYIYGETPLTSLNKIATICGIHPSDNVLELGCGRGRGCFFLAKVIGAKVTGVDLVRSFIQRGRFIRKIFQIDNLSFLRADFYEYDYSKTTVVYLYGVHLEEEQIKLLTKKLKNLPTGAKVISISYSIAQFAPKQFSQIKRFSLSFPWGQAFAYLSIKE